MALGIFFAFPIRCYESVSDIRPVQSSFRLDYSNSVRTSRSVQCKNASKLSQIARGMFEDDGLYFPEDKINCCRVFSMEVKEESQSTRRRAFVLTQPSISRVILCHDSETEHYKWQHIWNFALKEGSQFINRLPMCKTNAILCIHPSTSNAEQAICYDE